MSVDVGHESFDGEIGLAYPKLCFALIDSYLLTA
jgi:hypothetical protein